MAVGALGHHAAAPPGPGAGKNGDRRLRRSARVVFAFLSADWTPWQALRQLRRDWPKLVLAVDPRYGETEG